jgi:NADP-dependent 3-hydroxy acid dehydrogenase YdfG
MPEDRVLVITGASTGIGAATARHAAEAGYRLVLAARSQDKLDALVAELGEERALAVATDVTVWEDNERLVAAATERFGRIDVVFANAGFGAARGWLKETPEHWRDMVLTNVYGAALTIRATIDAVRASTGHFVLMGSVGGRRALAGSLYGATKFALTGVAESLRQELNGSGVRTTLVNPGVVDTPFHDETPKLRALEADDIARAVLFTVSQPPHVDINELLVRPTAQDN